MRIVWNALHLFLTSLNACYIQEKDAENHGCTGSLAGDIFRRHRSNLCPSISKKQLLGEKKIIVPDMMMMIF